MSSSWVTFTPRKNSRSGRIDSGLAGRPAPRVAVYNLGSSSAAITVNWSDIGSGGTKRVRDLVRRADLGIFTNGWTATNIPPHGSRLIKVS